jgi:hypothetical protein
MPHSDLEAASGPISWRSLIPSSVKVHGPTTHTWSWLLAERMSQSRPLTLDTKLKMVFDSLKPQKELDSGAASHKCRLQGESGLGPALLFWSWATLLTSLSPISSSSAWEALKNYTAIQWTIMKSSTLVLQKNFYFHRTHLVDKVYYNSLHMI